MSYVLSVIRPPVNGAAFGKAVVPEQDPFTTAGSATKMVIWALAEASATATVGEAKEIGRGLVDAPGREIRDPGTGLTFRIDPADNAPHPCPCGDEEDGENTCRRLVLPTDHAYADAEDALCLGCFTWKRGMEQCLPENTAHPEEK